MQNVYRNNSLQNYLRSLRYSRDLLTSVLSNSSEKRPSISTFLQHLMQSTENSMCASIASRESVLQNRKRAFSAANGITLVSLTFSSKSRSKSKDETSLFARKHMQTRLIPLLFHETKSFSVIFSFYYRFIKMFNYFFMNFDELIFTLTLFWINKLPKHHFESSTGINWVTLTLFWIFLKTFLIILHLCIFIFNLFPKIINKGQIIQFLHKYIDPMK